MTAGIYTRQNGVLVPAATIPGPRGSQGATGPTGATGAKGDPGGWVYSSVINAVTSLDTITTPGLYLNSSANATDSTTNTPVPLPGHLEVIRYSSGYSLQRYTPLSTSNTYPALTQFQRVNDVTTPTVWMPWAPVNRGIIGGGDMVGTGSPEGVVTAPVGTYYTNTAGTNGAWRWLKKSGIGNTGWSVVHGDTGERSITASLISGYGGALRIRRVDRSVYVVGRLTIDGTTKTAFAGQFLAATPAGFSGATQGWMLYTAQATTSFTNVRVQDQNGALYLATATAITSGEVWFEYVIQTSDAWPTTLPGVAA